MMKALIFALLLIVAGPLLLIWSLNILFNLNIEYSLTTWAAAFVLGGVIFLRAT